MDTPFGSLQEFMDAARTWVIGHVPNALRIVLILVVALILVRILKRLIKRLEHMAEDADPSTTSETEKRARTLGQISGQVVSAIVWIVACMLVLGELGLNLGPILAGAGIVGLAVGFGGQTLVKDIISGFFILFENQYRVNDVVQASGVSGLVEAVNLRTTVLRDIEGRVHIIPNGSISVVTNFTSGWSRALLDIGVAYKEDTDRCFEILKEVAREFEVDPAFGPKLDGKFEFPGVEKFADSAVVLRMMVRTRPLEQWNVMRELRRRIKKTFDHHGIEIPFPHMTLYMGDPSSNQSLRVEMTDARGTGAPQPGR
jgi:small conductance mechanosensitive channel